ncbi:MULTISPECIES: hypothetical protein [Actinoalloteichus]|uniref:Uncharacterized protein n=1 Tax=Actinoalloteichus fjordicus TaxID=1612552 RepID=A0AAC9PTD0_9PSEU|nr:MULTISPECIES: hypothetical protein [Actinoalloteichus]APU15998.1 hypothetical protein UA74_19865 [Actinoalloteichus fjordicus]APU22061.1 hypothetical protein UA75_20360 [Actinoalloteichus sp. GBA129-24]
MRSRWWIFFAAALPVTAVWWGLSRSAHVQRGMRSPDGEQGQA